MLSSRIVEPTNHQGRAQHRGSETGEWPAAERAGVDLGSSTQATSTPTPTTTQGTVRRTGVVQPDLLLISRGRDDTVTDKTVGRSTRARHRDTVGAFPISRSSV